MLLYCSAKKEEIRFYSLLAKHLAPKLRAAEASGPPVVVVY
jgi:hypothetical protein